MEISWKQCFYASSSLLILEALVSGAFITDLDLLGFFPPLLELSYFLYACVFAMERLHSMYSFHLGKSAKL